MGTTRIEIKTPQVLRVLAPAEGFVTVVTSAMTGVSTCKKNIHGDLRIKYATQEHFAMIATVTFDAPKTDLAIITTEEFQLSVWGDARITVTLENRPVTTVQGPQVEWMPPRPPFTEAAGKQKRKVDQVTPQEGGHELAAAAAEQHEGAHGPGANSNHLPVVQQHPAKKTKATDKLPPPPQQQQQQQQQRQSNSSHSELERQPHRYPDSREREAQHRGQYTGDYDAGRSGGYDGYASSRRAPLRQQQKRNEEQSSRRELTATAAAGCNYPTSSDVDWRRRREQYGLMDAGSSGGGHHGNRRATLLEEHRGTADAARDGKQAHGGTSSAARQQTVQQPIAAGASAGVAATAVTATDTRRPEEYTAGDIIWLEPYADGLATGATAELSSIVGVQFEGRVCEPDGSRGNLVHREDDLYVILGATHQMPMGLKMALLGKRAPGTFKIKLPAALVYDGEEYTTTHGKVPKGADMFYQGTLKGVTAPQQVRGYCGIA